jgi:aralkylamine N-acetyltransferase
MPTVYLIHGLPGSGKTVFARKLATATGAVLLNHDAIRTAVFGFDPPKEGFEECTARIRELIWTLTEKFVRHGVDVILDHGFWSRAERDEARVRSRSFGADPHFYRMVCPDAIADARVLRRNEAADPGTLFVPPGALELFRARFQPMGADELSIPIRTDLPNESADSTALPGISAAGQPPDAGSGRPLSLGVADGIPTYQKMGAAFTEDLSAIDWVKLARIFELAPLGVRDPGKLRETFTNSSARCFVWHEGELIGAGRAITDGIAYAAIFDVVLLPEYQGKGIGRQMMTFLAERSKAGNIILHSVPGKEEFYRKLGYCMMKTAMGRFANPEKQRLLGYIE